jgi:hypothetical protein
MQPFSRDTLVDLDGVAVVRSPMIYSDKPEEIVNYYPTGLRTRDMIENYGIPVPAELSYSTMGRYAVMTGKPIYGNARIIELPDGGATKCIKQEIVPIPCPKVRKGIATRWANSRWEKYLQAFGWIAA